LLQQFFIGEDDADDETTCFSSQWWKATGEFGNSDFLFHEQTGHG
jgi:hypothetical protein